MNTQQPTSGQVKLNLGCGARYIKTAAWYNADAQPAPPHVHEIDLYGGLPFPDNSFDFIYSSHVLDHFDLTIAAFILGEIRRCLRPAGIARIVLPDLEYNCQRYLQSAKENSREPEKHFWFMIELLDQLTRNAPGGEKAKYLRSIKNDKKSALETWIRPLLGAEMLAILDTPISQSRNPLQFLKEKIKIFTQKRSFLKSGEKHYWAYDWICLSNMATRVGFHKTTKQTYDKSIYADYSRENLDMQEGKEYKPGSLYIECVK